MAHECEILAHLKKDLEFREYWNAAYTNKQFVEPITARAALKGGRTEVFYLSIELTDEQIENGFRIRYIDFVSLYPAVQKKCLYPKAHHPKVYLSEDLKHREARLTNWDKHMLNKYFGMVSACVLPPTNLYIPVLPCHIREKCIYALCHACAKENRQELEVTPKKKATLFNVISLTHSMDSG